MCKQYSAVFSDLLPSISLIGKEEYKWYMFTPKPRYSEQMESGVLCSKGTQTIAFFWIGAEFYNFIDVPEGHWLLLEII